MILVLVYGLLSCAASFAESQSCAPPAHEILFVEIRSHGDPFIMGDELFGPRTRQTISYDYFFSRFPITNRQFSPFIEDGGYSQRSCWTRNGWKWKGARRNPASWTDPGFNGPDQPVVGVSWYEAVAFCNWLSRKEGLDPVYDDSGRVDPDAPGYRLPMETEWEYAAAKGSPEEAERLFPWGDAWNQDCAVCSVAPAEAACTAPVGSRSPRGDTPQGLADMGGNIWQWCSDNAQRDDFIARSSSTDRYHFRSDSTTSYMVLRGGSWASTFKNGFRAAFRGFVALPGSRHDVTGFRIVRR
jgi:formylglycine-generating enzyme required for sulfatase activity